MVIISLLYIGLQQDTTKAIQHLKIAAEKRYADAMYELGILFLGGHEFFKNTILQNKKEGMKRIQEAANLDNFNSMKVVQVPPKSQNSEAFKEMIREKMRELLEISDVYEGDEIIDEVPLQSNQFNNEEFEIELYVEGLRAKVLSQQHKKRDGSQYNVNEISQQLVRSYAKEQRSQYDPQMNEVMEQLAKEQLLQYLMKRQVQHDIEIGENLLKKHKNDPSILIQIKERLALLRKAKQRIQGKDKKKTKSTQRTKKPQKESTINSTSQMNMRTHLTREELLMRHKLSLQNEKRANEN